MYKIPRTKSDVSKDIKPLKQSGIYFLIGKNDEDKQVVYVGQGIQRDETKGVLYRALEPHNMDYWTEAVILVSSTEDQIGATELNYLEHNFKKLIEESKRAIVANGNTPTAGTFTEEQECDMRYIIENAKMLIGALGYSFLKPYIKKDSDILFYNDAKCQIVSDGFMLLEGSKIKETVANSCPSYIKQRRIDEKGNIKDSVIIKDIFFSSPSAAAAFVSGSSVSGNELWKNKDGIKLKDIK